jgi:hypothetical protein
MNNFFFLCQDLIDKCSQFSTLNHFQETNMIQESLSTMKCKAYLMEDIDSCYMLRNQIQKYNLENYECNISKTLKFIFLI